MHKVLVERASSESFAERLRQMVWHAKIEITPSERILEKIDQIPLSSELSVTASPTKEIEETLELSSKLIEKGYKVIPHLASRRIHNHDQLARISDFLDHYNVEEIFAIGGDGKPFGDYSNSYDLLEKLLDMSHSIKEIGVGGYPEGHPLIDDDTILAYLKAKISLAREFGVGIHINSQACYDPDDVVSWLSFIKKHNIDIPIYLGVSAPMNILKLAQTSQEIGVGDSVAFLRMVGVEGALKSAMYSPNPLLNSLSGKPGMDQVKGLHLFTFNHIKASVEWQQNFKVASS